jgi:mycofactocin precursor
MSTNSTTGIKPIENDKVVAAVETDDEELLIEEISIDGMCGVY